MTHWRTGTWGMTCSTKWAAVSAIRRAPQAGQNPLRLGTLNKEKVGTKIAFTRIPEKEEFSD